MAKIVCIDTKAVRAGICEVGDIVSIHDDNVELSGPGYANFTIIKICRLTALELRKKLISPDQDIAVKMLEEDKWRLRDNGDAEKPFAEKMVWRNAEGKWCDLVKNPKYSFSVKDLTSADRAALRNTLTTDSARDILIAKHKEKISLNAKNCVESIDLNSIVVEK